MPPITAIIGAHIITPDLVLDDHALLLDGAQIAALVPTGTVPREARRIDAGGLTLTPGFIDIQVNGGGGVLFNDHPSPATIARIGAAHRPFGTTGFLPTLISDGAEAMTAARAAVADGLDQGLPGLLGLHLEGPFLSRARHGIHDPRQIRPLTATALEELAAPRRGALVVTLAPEEAGPEAIGALARAGVRVSAGHTAATYAQTRAALAAGVTGFTHLFNAMPQLASREPGPVAAALESRAWCGLIADGHHVDDAMLRLALRAKADGRVMLVTDAMAAAGTDADSFTLAGETVTIVGGRCTDAAGTLAGSNLTMIAAVRHCVRRLGQPLAEAVRMASLEPARFLGIDHLRGSLAPGRAADVVALDPGLDVAATMIGGDVELFASQLAAR